MKKLVLLTCLLLIFASPLNYVNAYTIGEDAETSEDAVVAGTGIENIVLSTYTAHQGEEIIVSAVVSDEIHVQELVVKLVNLQGVAVGFIPLTYVEAQGQWTGSYYVELEAGEYTISSSALGIDMNNVWYYNSDEIFTVEAFEEEEPVEEEDYSEPVFESIEVSDYELNPEDELVMKVVVTDDSEITGVSAYISDGRQLYETINFEYSDEEEKWIGIYPVEKDVRPGNWSVEFNAIDSNNNYGYQGLEENIIVKNPVGDWVGPEIKSVDVNKETLNVGEKLFVHVKANDQSGIEHADIYLNSDWDYYSGKLFYDELNNEWIGEFSIEKNIPDGQYSLFISLIDSRYNFTEQKYSSEITIYNTDADTTAPVVELLEVSSKEVSVGEELTFKAKLSDQSGVNTAYLSMRYEEEYYAYLRHNIDLEYNKAEDLWIGKYTIIPSDRDGNWTVDIETFDVYDQYGTQTFEDVFSINNPNPDLVGPTIKSVNITSNTIAKVDEEISFEVAIKEQPSEVDFVRIDLNNYDIGSYESFELEYNKEKNLWVASYPVSLGLQGTYQLEVIASDLYENWSYFNTEKTIEIINPNLDTVEPIVDIDIIPQVVGAGEEVSFIVRATDDISGIREVQGNIWLYDQDGKLIITPISFQFDTKLDAWVASYLVKSTDQLGPIEFNYEVYDKAGNWTYNQIGHYFYVVEQRVFPEPEPEEPTIPSEGVEEPGDEPQQNPDDNGNVEKPGDNGNQDSETKDEVNNEDQDSKENDKEDKVKESTQPVKVVVVKPSTTVNETSKQMQASIKAIDVKELKEKEVLVIKPEAAETQKELKVELTTDVIKTLTEKKNELKIDKGDTEVTIPTQVLQQIVSAAGDQPVSITVQKVEAPNALGAVYDFTITAGDKVVSDFNGQKVTLTFNVDSDLVKGIETSEIKAFFYNETTKEWEVLADSEYDPKTGEVTATTTHFSTYGVFKYEGSAAESGNDQVSGEILPKTASNLYNVLGIGITLFIVAAGLFFVKRRSVRA